MKRSVRGRAKHALLAVSLIAGLLLVGNPAEAVHDEGFALQGDVYQSGSQPLDWTDLMTTATAPSAGVAVGDGVPKATLPGGFLRAAFGPDYSEPDHSAYATGTKDTLPISLAGAGDWQCKQSNNIGNKFNLVNAYAAAKRVTTATADSDVGDLLVFFGSEIASPNGDRNVGMWLLQDRNVNCQSSGGNTDWTGHHVDGDIFVVSAFTNGGTKANITVYEWDDASPADHNADVGGSLVLKFSTGDLNDARCAGGNLSSQSPADSACAIENGSAEVDPPWNAPDADGGNLDINEFVEGGINLGNLGLDRCFSTAVINSRSSQEPGSTLHDYVRMQFETCGNAAVHKYIDVDMSGTNNAGDVTTGTAVSGWAMTVNGPSPSTATVCQGTTDSDGNLACTTTGTLQNLAPGDYTVTENQKSGFFNTDPGPFDTGSTVTKSFTVGVGDTAVEVGNTCFVAKTFEISNVPSGVGTINVDWQVTTGTATQSTGTVALGSPSGGVSTATVNNTFTQQSVIAWQWYLASDPSTKISGASGEDLSGAGYPTCAKTNTDSFDNTTVKGSKFKDIDGDGVWDVTEPGLGGVVFELRQGSTTTGTIITTATSAMTSSGTVAQGDYTFPVQVPPGTYTITEQVPTGWVQTTPTAGTGRTITVVLNQASATVPAFGNTPLSRISVSFTSLADLPGTSTDATKVKTITCKDGDGSGSTVASSTTNTATSSDLQLNQNKVVCTIEYEDP
jgi:hypothetical protein